MLELVRDLGHNKGVSLILSSHLLPDVEYTCDHVVVMDKGQVAAQGRSGSQGTAPAACSSCGSKATCAASSTCSPPGGMDVHATDEDVMRVFVPAEAGGDQRAIFTAASNYGVQVRHLRPSVPTLEDVFAKALGEK